MDGMATRREFIGRAGTVAGAAAFGLAGYPDGAGTLPAIDPEPAGRDRRTNQPGLSILILGGTGFIGPHVVRHALARGHEITLFNRGRTNTHLFPEVEKLVGDRNDDVAALEGRRWDAVIDNSGYTPDQVRLSVDVLRDATAQYLFTSTRAVYTDYTAPVMNEDAPVGPKDLPESEWRGYGPNKVLAERVVEGGFGTRTLIVRPPVIVGPGDRSDRFTYWPDRIDAGGEVLVQGDPTDPVQFIDVRDLSEFYVHLLEQQTAGVLNSVGPGAPLSSAELVYGIRAITATPVSFTWVDWDFLAERGQMPQQQLAFWQPPRGRYLNYGRMDSSRGIAAGLRFRPLAVIAKDTLDWHRSREVGGEYRLRTGLNRATEAELLAAWREN
ncbi:MAG: NAD-dependent epimerase/dehydratase family protein [Gemmatimonadetes bacterium]|nr:NAD-dependent epimerase/dehydratase family protein [Gemmatimonadota bacterium]MYB97469.1 NAD-dependent epimerase/dehydratase family protein [Gemmatimonadota bacterium]MYI45127.1 NAD-dependent epimerase/dehydratase family protein [Gemmatimonadota bacterium]